MNYMRFLNSKKTKFKLLFLPLMILGFFLVPQSLLAKEYYYQHFDVDIKINEDSTFDVTEKQTYYLNGNFGFFDRDVSLKDIDAITDVEVFDGSGNKIPKSELDIGSGRGEKNIQWNFSRRNFSGEEKSWTVKYKVHGGISFLKDYDEIYWNAVPRDRNVPIQNVKVRVNLPDNKIFKSDLIRLYVEETLAAKNSYFKNGNTQAFFEGKNLKPYTNFTIAAGFPKEIVSQSAYWKDFLMMYYGYILSIIIFFSCVIIGFAHWYKTEMSREGKRAIVPQYEPPENLRPAMAEIIVKEKLTEKGLAATIIDLAVRGYVNIEEDKKTGFEKLLPYFSLIILIMVVLFFSFIFLSLSATEVFIKWFLGGLVIIYISKAYVVKKSDYIITEIISSEKKSSLEDYEKEYLGALFSFGKSFSTKELKKDLRKSKELYKKIKKVKDTIYEETELDTGAFEVGLTAEQNKKIIWAILFIGIIVLFRFFGLPSGQFFVFALVATISIIGLWSFIKYEARLSDKGILLKEDWLGFKMYLETAEKYRMQNLKPEYFEKYLPYAIIFGVEKKWAKTFESMHMPQPVWYASSAYAATGSSLNSASSFSPVGFSNSFSSSFTSAFSSSGGGGVSGGGGGAGGGGGGGGGGAG